MDVSCARLTDSVCDADLQLMAKCETRQSLFNFQSIAQAADAIIMSRGNLGLDVLPEKMALVQKSVISNCNLMGKPVLITRVVDTMVNTPRPTRCDETQLSSDNYNLRLLRLFFFNLSLSFTHCCSKSPIATCLFTTLDVAVVGHQCN